MLDTLRDAVEHHSTTRKALLSCGFVSSVWWIVVDVVASFRYPNYSYVDQTISELSAEGAPTRPFMLRVNVVPYATLTGAYGLGVLGAAGATRAGRFTGGLLIGGSATGLLGGMLFPMSVRGSTGNMRNVMHVPYGVMSILIFLLSMCYGSRLLDKRFRYYSYASIALLLWFGMLMGSQSGRMVADEPTPWMGLEERVAVYATMLWFAVLAAGLLRAEGVEVACAATPSLTTGSLISHHGS